MFIGELPEDGFCISNRLWDIQKTKCSGSHRPSASAAGLKQEFALQVTTLGGRCMYCPSVYTSIVIYLNLIMNHYNTDLVKRYEVIPMFHCFYFFYYWSVKFVYSLPDRPTNCIARRWRWSVNWKTAVKNWTFLFYTWIFLFGFYLHINEPHGLWSIQSRSYRSITVKQPDLRKFVGDRHLKNLRLYWTCPLKIGAKACNV